MSEHTEFLWAYLVAPAAGAMLGVAVAFSVRDPNGEKIELETMS